MFPPPKPWMRRVYQTQRGAPGWIYLTDDMRTRNYTAHLTNALHDAGYHVARERRLAIREKDNHDT
jgi:hypothetical protein